MLVSLSVIDVFTYGSITKDLIFQGIMLKLSFHIAYVSIIRKIDILNNLKLTKSNKQLALHIFYQKFVTNFLHHIRRLLTIGYSSSWSQRV